MSNENEAAGDPPDDDSGAPPDVGAAVAPAGPAVRIRDLSGGVTDEPVEVVRGFESAEHAAAFARRYVRDSVENCRARGADADAVLAAWFAFGEDADVLGPDGEPTGWSAGMEVRGFAEDPPDDPEERDWRALDPRRDPDGDAPDEDAVGEDGDA